MKCIFCPADVVEGADFCHACGGRLSWRCEQCGQRNPTPFLRCRQCGAAHEHRPATNEVLRSERKLVTILFADIRGSQNTEHQESGILTNPSGEGPSTKVGI